MTQKDSVAPGWAPGNVHQIKVSEMKLLLKPYMYYMCVNRIHMLGVNAILSRG